MKIFSSELGQKYDTYTFGYCVYARREPGDSFLDFYAKGFLPYSGSSKHRDIFYQARSARVVLGKWEMSSENRRIAKKFDGMFTKTRIPLSAFERNEEFMQFCMDYFVQRHGPGVLPRERLELILTSGLISEIITYRKDGTIVGYIFEVADTELGHYWYSFYDLSYAHQSLGMWLMLDALRDAKVRELKHYYLGTVYGSKALYKANFEPLEWWDGATWSADMGALKERGRQDGDRALNLTDRWKEGQTLF